MRNINQKLWIGKFSGEANYERLRFEHSWEGYDTSSWSENFSGYVCYDW